ncbi:MAG: hypothetical protein MZV65_32115 [Chromatiales bacterium]|nr:hypothetical protein [Chromatiales bacterium]
MSSLSRDGALQHLDLGYYAGDRATYTADLTAQHLVVGAPASLTARSTLSKRRCCMPPAQAWQRSKDLSCARRRVLSVVARFLAR